MDSFVADFDVTDNVAIAVNVSTVAAIAVQKPKHTDRQAIDNAQKGCIDTVHVALYTKNVMFEKYVLKLFRGNPQL
ncbi:hypothetical protein DMN77_08785 [Paenibacillus sp. 79R4]|nr:hypothetical protein [Paenibacillus sp. 79R4]